MTAGDTEGKAGSPNHSMNPAGGGVVMGTPMGQIGSGVSNPNMQQPQPVMMMGPDGQPTPVMMMGADGQPQPVMMMPGQ